MTHAHVLVVLLGASLASAENPDDWFPMPNGKLMHRECIHQFDHPFEVRYDEATRASTVHLTGPGADPEVIVHAPCPHEVRNASISYYSGWAADARTAHTAGFGSMVNGWTVPAAPTSRGPAPPLIASSVYIFNGLEDGGGVPGASSLILQPVLQYGKSGCLVNPLKFADWYLTAYLVNGAGRAYCGANVGPLAPGEQVLGNMTLLDADTNEWGVRATRVATGEASEQSSALGEGLVIDAAYLALEMMVTYGCDAYPADGSVTFDSTALTDRLGAPLVAQEWAKVLGHTECDQDVLIGGALDPVTISWDPTL